MLHQSLETFNRIRVRRKTEELFRKLILVFQHGSGLHERGGVEDQKSVVDSRDGLDMSWISIAGIPLV
jgi:hypothetical protein